MAPNPPPSIDIVCLKEFFYVFNLCTIAKANEANPLQIYFSLLIVKERGEIMISNI